MKFFAIKNAFIKGVCHNKDYMYTFSAKSIELLSILAHDAAFTGKDIPSNLFDNKFILNVKRVYFEQPFEGKFLFFFNIIKYKSRTAKITFDNIKNFKIHWKEEAFNSPNDIHGILDIWYEKEENVLVIETEYILFKLVIIDNINVSVEDESEISKEFYMTDFGQKIFDYEEWKKEYLSFNTN